MDAEFPPKLQFLFEPARYKVLYGGRGGAKSWGIARALLIQGVAKPLRVLCAREMQNSIRDSVHRLLGDQVEKLGLGGFYDVQQAMIKGVNGTEFSFEGIRHNVGKIKSYEGVDICWIEEAVNISKASLDILIPTIRKEGSEIWISFNPELETDEVYQRFVKNPPAQAKVMELTWRDNPWFPATLNAEMEDLKLRDPDAYLHVWEGKCRVMLEGAVYAQELRDAMLEGRVTKVPYDKTVGVHTFWDLGWADQTTIWFMQKVGFELRLIDYYENNLKSLDHYLRVLQAKKYIYESDWLPHDAKAKDLGSGKTIEELMRSNGRRVRVLPRQSLVDGINAARTIFPQCWFDAEKCAEGLNALRHYRFDIDPKTKTYSKNPLHDWSSHAADAFRYLAIGYKEPRKPRTGVVQGIKKAVEPFAVGGWMR